MEKMLFSLTVDICLSHIKVYMQFKYFFPRLLQFSLEEVDLSHCFYFIILFIYSEATSF